ncbi:major capsid protein [Minwuia thermotolerans]|uniref:Major capsid protein E n=1 Tax=Minwuia thermotolerans TaxID=2056226 RepID=A0A2M9G2M4_9PROT|nr:major capsid protein [Minwuia thermotolerans]PJK29950.1 major capsid protein E [Minwuia thermotolerans]
MADMDVFKADGFSMISMTAAINAQEFLPSFLGDLGLFEPKPIRTEKFEIESYDGVLTLIQSDQRGAPISEQKRELRKVRDFRTVRLARGDTIQASEIQNIRAFGQESELMQVEAEVARRQMKLKRDLELTWENMRLGAVQGIVTDADASTIYNFFTEFGVSQPSEIDFDLDNASPASGAVRKKCSEVVRAMARAAAGVWIEGRTYPMGLCGDAFWDDLTGHSEVRETYLQTQQAADLRQGNAFESFRYGGITWVNYRGTDDNSKVAVGTDKAKFFPVEAPGAFEVAFSPAESFDFVNTPGLPFYSWPVWDRDRNMWVRIEMASYPMFYPTRPKMLQRAKRT